MNYHEFDKESDTYTVESIFQLLYNYTKAKEEFASGHELVKFGREVLESVLREHRHNPYC